MPTIEIASINSTALDLNQRDFDVAIIEENQLNSHRGLFYDLLRQQDGVIVHIGNPDLKNRKESGFFAGKIIDWKFEPAGIINPEIDSTGRINNSGANQQYQFRFLDQYKSDIDKLLKVALDKSPIKKVFFLTDYQSGPEKENIEIIFTIGNLWEQHDKSGLNLNTIYEMYAR